MFRLISSTSLNLISYSLSEMRISCNGCRALRKGCSEDCSLRACLEWLKSAEAQANATVFLAKFYGRAGLINLINAAAPHLRPDIFRSLLYEACGRIVDPIYGSLGLMTSGDWTSCQAAVEAVLGGTQLDVGRLQGCDIRHISKGSAASLHDVRTRNRRKRWVSAEYPTESTVAKFTITGWDSGEDHKYYVVDQESEIRARSHHLLNFDEPPVQEPSEVGLGLGLELTLGLNPGLQTYLSTVIQISDSEE